MNKTKKLRVSIVIPVYNEADHLDACLAAIGSQATPAFEVLVVDNNSSDASVAVAQAYKFVTILREPKHHRSN
jgi:glycosyltransferase involved in cell wall biosynthesis